MKIIDIERWDRKEYYQHFKTFEEPFYGIVSNIQCTESYNYCKKNNISFFAYYLFYSMLSLNKVEEFKYRIIDDDVVKYEKIHTTCALGRKDGSYAHSFISYTENFQEFIEELDKEKERINNIKGLGITENTSRYDVIHCSPVPWISFSGLTHARKYSLNDSIPKISFGKIKIEHQKIYMPVSFNAHHGLSDGFHAGLFYKYLEQYLNGK